MNKFSIYFVSICLIIVCFLVGCNTKTSLPDCITVREASRSKECTPYIVMFFSQDQEFRKVENVQYPDGWPMGFIVPENALLLQDTPRAYTANQGTLPIMDLYFLSKYKPAEIREMILSNIDLDNYRITEKYEEPHRWIFGVNSLSFVLHPNNDKKIDYIVIDTRFGAGFKSGYTVTSIRVKGHSTDAVPLSNHHE